MAIYHGTPGDDVRSGTKSADTMYGNDGNDSLEGGNGGDLLYDGRGDDHLYGGNGGDTLNGNVGNDTIQDLWGTGNKLNGGDGNDWLEGLGVLHGGAGNDRLTATEHSMTGRSDQWGDAGADTFAAADFGGGWDTRVTTVIHDFHPAAEGDRLSLRMWMLEDPILGTGHSPDSFAVKDLFDSNHDGVMLV